MEHECEQSKDKIKFIQIHEDLKMTCKDCNKELTLEEVMP